MISKILWQTADFFSVAKKTMLKLVSVFCGHCHEDHPVA